MGGSLTRDEEEWVAKLKSAEYGQSHLLDAIPSGDTRAVKRLIAQLSHVDKTYPGGLLGYIERARKMLKESKEGVNPYEGCVPSVPEGEKLSLGSEVYQAYESLGIQEMANVCFVLVAGGLGERLGYSSIKIGLPSETTTNTTYAELYCRYILAYQARAQSQTGRSDLTLPLAVMTSDDTHAATLQLFGSNQYFGLKEQQVTIMKQEKVPALMDDQARIATDSSDPSKIQTKPHGHGDVHTLLQANDLPSRWVREGRRWVVFFQDTNPLVFRSLPAVIGVSAKKRFAMNSVVVPRKPGEAVGGICKLQQPDGTELTINVEYNQLDPLLRTTGDRKGDIADPSSPQGNSKYPGNINVLVFDLTKYAPILKKSKGAIPEFVNPKYKDSTKTSFKSPTRLECMMQEFARLFDSSVDPVGVTELERWMCFSAVKNAVRDAAEKNKKNLPPECAYSGEADVYHNAVTMLRMAAEKAQQSVDIQSGENKTFADVTLPLPPRVVLFPSWALTFDDMVKKFTKKNAILKVTNRSTLIVEGDVRFEGLELDGAAVLKAITPEASLVVRNLKVENPGWVMESLPPPPASGEEDSVPEKLRIRGFRITQVATKEYSNAKGTLIVP